MATHEVFPEITASYSNVVTTAAQVCIDSSGASGKGKGSRGGAKEAKRACHECNKHEKQGLCHSHNSE